MTNTNQTYLPNLKQILYSMNNSEIPYTLVPFVDDAQGEDQALPAPRVRKATTGKMVNHPLAVELREINEQVNLLGNEFVREIIKFDGRPLTRELYQSYLQGYVAGTESYENLLERVRSFRDYRLENYRFLMSSDAKTIIEEWFRLLSIDISGAEGSPFRLFVRKIGPQKNPGNPSGEPKLRDHSTIYRWYKENKKPQSITDLIWYDKMVRKIAGKG